MQYDKVKDSGQRQQFSTGAVRDIQVGKGRFDLLPATATRRTAKHYENGSGKYGDWNWSKGMPFSRFLDSAMRHLFNYADGDRSEDHLAACVFNVNAIMHEEEMIERGLMPKELDDLPRFVKPTIDETEAKEWGRTLNAEANEKTVKPHKCLLGNGNDWCEVKGCKNSYAIASKEALDRTLRLEALTDKFLVEKCQAAVHLQTETSIIRDAWLQYIAGSSFDIVNLRQSDKRILEIVLKRKGINKTRKTIAGIRLSLFSGIALKADFEHA